MTASLLYLPTRSFSDGFKFKVEIACDATAPASYFFEHVSVDKNKTTETMGAFMWREHLSVENWHIISELMYFVYRVNMHLSEVDKLAVLVLVIISRKPLVSCMEGLNSTRARNLIWYLSTVQLHFKSCKLTRRTCYKLFGRTAVCCERGGDQDAAPCAETMAQ